MEKRNTVQRQLVLDAVSHLANHPTADGVYNEVIRSHPSVSKATVYRNLASLAEDGVIRHVFMPDSADRFDHCVESDHDHIICTECGVFGDAPIAKDAQTLNAFVARETGFVNINRDVVYSGICPKCAKRKQYA